MFADASLYRSLASLHRAGVSWPEAMASAGGHSAEGQAVGAALSGGATLADALEAHVDPLDVALIRAGEHSGTLEQSLERIADRHDEKVRNAGARRSALLPLPDFIQGHFLQGLKWSAAVLAPLYALLWITRSRGVSPGTDDHPGTHPPRARGLRRSAVEEADARALTALADGFDAGIPLNELLRLSRRAGAGGRVAFDLYRGAPRIRDGQALGTIWSAFPASLAQRLDVGEKTGELGVTCRHLASELRFEIEMRRKKLTAILPVAVVLIIGCIIGMRVIGFYSNMYSKALSGGR